MGYFAGGITSSGEDLENIAQGQNDNDDESFVEDYINQLQDLEYERSTTADITQRMQELKNLLKTPVQRNPIYDLASALSKGLIQNSQSARPNVLGYGLAAGFDIFNQRQQQIIDKKNEYDNQLMMMARQELQAENDAKRDLLQKGLDASFKLNLEKAKLGLGGMYTGKDRISVALNHILRVEAIEDPEEKRKAQNTPEYRSAVQVAQQRQRVVTEQGVLEVPGLDVTKIIGPLLQENVTQENNQQDMTVPEGAVFTGKYDDQKKPIFQDLQTGEIFTETN
ncbi:MAG TPA: hypothetical protein DEB18_03405 [Leeuwenhoekiella sp.]|nr:hypothetical protein [Leeuwenhoekiella sp.]